MKKRILVGLAVLLSVTSGLLANGLNLNGFGARACAMGGAFVGLADDFTAVFWNPAGLAQLKKGGFGLTADVLMPSAKYTLGPYSMETSSKKYPAGLLGYFQPIGNNIVVGLGAYTLSGLGAAWDNTGLEATLVYPTPPAAFTPALAPSKWESFIGSITIAPAIAVKVTEQVYLGATFNINYGFFKTDQWGRYLVLGPTAPPDAGQLPARAASAAPMIINFGQQTLDVKGWGFGATFGLLVKPAEWISLGATFRTQSKINLSGTTEIENVNLIGLENSSATKMSVASPMWLAGGVALKPIENLTWTFDAQYTNWSKLQAIAVEFGDPYWAAGLGEEAALLLDWKNQVQYRTGIEYDFGKFAIRGGYYYDPAPAPDATLNILTPSFTFNSVIGGFGYKSGGLKLDVALEYLMGKDRTVAASGDNLPGAYEMNILVPIISLSYGW
jgi:long-chain fatty acid transport protein